MNIAFLTTDDPLYLPEFFARVLDQCAESVRGVYVVPPLYKNESALAAAGKYWRTFGTRNFLGLAARVARAKVQRRSVAEVCRRRGVCCEAVREVNAPPFLARLGGLSVDLIVSVSCPQIFKAPLIALSARGILNIHGAILPQYRGVMPSFWMLANGETEAGVSIYFVNDKIDAGDLCGQRIFDVLAGESLDRFLRRSKAIAADLLLEVLDGIEEGRIERTPLDLSKGSYYSWPDATAVKRFQEAGREVW